MNAKKTGPPPPPPPKKKSGKKSAAKPAAKQLQFKKPTGKFRPPKLVVVGVEGWGKTSLAANIPDIAILMPSVETGYLTLLGAGRVPEVPALVTEKWKESLAALDNLGDAKALALDELSGFQAQCFEYICRNEFGNDWKKFDSYGRGYKLVTPEWLKFLAKLERLGIMIVALSHCSIETFKDPMSDDHDRYVSALHKTMWGLTRRWADACLFGTFRSIVDEESGKGIGGDERVLYTEHRDTHDAKNRYGMESELEVPDDPAGTWAFLWDAITNPLEYEE